MSMSLPDWEEALFVAQSRVDEAIHHPDTPKEAAAWLLKSYQNLIEARHGLRKANEIVCRPTR